MSVAKNAIPGKRNCTQCPSFLVDGTQRETMGADISGPLCAIKMLPLVMPSQPRDAQGRALASNAINCSEFGKEVELKTMPHEYAPTLGVGVDKVAISAAADDQTNARCSDCVHFVRSAEVQSETGWTASLCKSTGSLMPDNKLQYYAKQCGSFKRRVGPVPRNGNLTSFAFLPYFSPNFGKVDVAANYRRSVRDQIHPSQYVTDREVTESHKRRGIRAWRRVDDPDNYGASTYLPIYEPQSFSPELQLLVPKPEGDNRPDLYADHGGHLYSMAVMWRELDETPAWWGQGGVGKTEFANHLAWLMQAPFHRVSINSASELDDIMGKMLFEQNETKFHYGRFPRAWKSPGVILLDEPNTGPNELWQALRPLTDNSKVLVLDQNKSEQIPRGPDTYLAMAMNPQWDPRNVGTNTIGDADSSRLMHMFFELPPEDIEVAIVQVRLEMDGWQLDDKQVRALMGVARDLRQASINGSLHTSWGIRHQIKVARALKWWNPVVAYRRAVGDALEPSQLEFVLGAVNSHYQMG